MTFAEAMKRIALVEKKNIEQYPKLKNKTKQ